MTLKIKLEVVSIETGEVVATVVPRYSDPPSVERVMAGMLLNMDRERYFVREVTVQS